MGHRLQAHMGTAWSWHLDRLRPPDHPKVPTGPGR